MRSLPSIKLLLAGTVAAIIASGSAFAQQKTSFSYTPGPEVTGKYLQRHSLDVGDVPGHVLALSEIVTTYPADKPAPVIADVRMIEGRAILQADFASSNGPVFGYRTFKMANGDKIFAKTSIVAQTSQVDGKPVTKTFTADVIYGGTGKFKNIRGTMTTGSITNFSSTVPQPAEFEYYFVE